MAACASLWALFAASEVTAKEMITTVAKMQYA
jgi:hypothetical protein